VSEAEAEQPQGTLTMRVPAMPADANAAGDIFGGWVMSQMDLAAGIRGAERAHGRVVTMAVQTLVFRRPVKVGDTLSIYTEIEKIGRSSITLSVEAWAQRYLTRDVEKVTEASFVMVALDRDGRPMAVPPEAPSPKADAAG
jgi:acyl-CoA thioesterase YciA